ncbi:serine/threonine-protein kinase D6PKL1-like [Malania oleifera]|uniref:serine/threonine-protein kinase D6PKL1-like n=1 Tax=Malania oleifera TaxID=397392 RepID=UPI0025AE500A|nr:serine/threonine-protein kinase D6PKL1-like [Malania oleifera]
MDPPAPPPSTTSQSPPLEDLADDLRRLSLNSTTTTTTTTTSISWGSDTTWTATSVASGGAKPHAPSGDPRRNAVLRTQAQNGTIGLGDLRFVQRLGSGDIGTVFLAELRDAVGMGCLFAAKVMDKKELEGRNKEGRAGTEREILQMLDHPFLPILYAALDSSRWSCLLTEFCPGGDLHVLRQRQPDKRFDDATVRFYATEVVAALEYLHMMGIIYRDLKPENVLVRSDGHIMLTDFDLSLKCDSSTSTAQMVSDQNRPTSEGDCRPEPPPSAASSCIIPSCIVPAVTCFHKKRRRRKKQGDPGDLNIVAEPVDVRSMSFVGTYEYLAPEIVSGEGHGSAVDWWTLGVFVFEMFYGVTPFKGVDNELTLANILARALEFPKEPPVPAAAKDLMSQLLVKDPARRLGSVMGAGAVKRHPFFNGVNWALLRCASPPYVPRPTDFSPVVCDKLLEKTIEYY